MTAFEKNITSLYREKGAVWLAHLPKIVEKTAASWGLDRLEPFENLSYNYVLSGYQRDRPVVLKLSIDTLSLQREAQSLETFSGYGAVSILERQEGALLLERAVPGTPLKTKSRQQAIEIACGIAQKLHQAPLPREHRFPHITEWLADLDKEWNIPQETLQKARTFKNQLLDTHRTSVLLHGDLHQDNILSNGNDWLVIDPKGVIGDPINEVWAFVEDHKTDLPFIAHNFDFKLEDVVKWYFVHLVLAACWQVEDDLDPKRFLLLSNLTESEFKKIL